MQTRPPLTASYSEHHTTVYLQPAGPEGTDEAFVYCQLKHRACRRDSWSHGAHTALFNVRRALGRALCLPAPAGRMPFPLRAQGEGPQSPLREPPNYFGPQ